VGDVVMIATPSLGALVNRVNYADAIAPWTFGAGALMRNLASGDCWAGARQIREEPPVLRLRAWRAAISVPSACSKKSG